MGQHIFLSRAMKSLLLILAVLTLDLKFAFGQCQCTCNNPEGLNDQGFRTWSPLGLRQYNVNRYELPPELQLSAQQDIRAEEQKIHDKLRKQFQNEIVSY